MLGEAGMISDVSLGRTCVAMVLMAGLSLFAAKGENRLQVGVDANYSLGMEEEGKRWSWDGNEGELFRGMAERGAKKLRVRLWTGDEGTNGKAYATEVVKRALAAGMDPYLVIFLSEDWADMVKQPVPAIWKDLDLDARAEAVRKYSRGVVEHFRGQGLESHLYEIGNEIDYGICGVYPSKGAKKDPESLGRRHWPDAAKLIRASQAGVLEADPEAKFMLHIAHWWDAEFCMAFFRFMLANGVRVDFAGLSYFPSSNIGGSLEMEQFGEVVTKLNGAISRPVVVPETAYPSTNEFKGQFSRWKKETPGYPLTAEGQRRWLEDFLEFCEHHPAIDSVYYWSPEWYGEGMWKAFALFGTEGAAKPAWGAFKATREKPKRPVYFEARGESLTEVPILEARKRAVPVLREELAKAGRVNTDYIKAITERKLMVEGYGVRLRASLMGNLDLMVEGIPEISPDWKPLLGKLNKEEEKAVIFVRKPDRSIVEAILEGAEEMGVEAVVHEVAEDAPLKFGLGAGWQTEE